MNNVTLAVCVYNCELFIEETLTHIVSQTFKNYDLLIVDDCSTDNTKKIINAFLKKNPITHEIISLKKNKGIANARQICLNKAKTKYILFVDSDDLPHPTLLEQQYNKIISDKSIMAVSSWSKFIDFKSKKISGGLYLGPRSKEVFMSLASKGKLIFLPVQTLFNREIALNVGGYKLDGFPNGHVRYSDFCEDLDLWTRMSDLYKDGKYMITIPKVLYSYRKRNLGLSSNSFNMSLKIKFIKQNLKLRRSCVDEKTFIDFMKTVTKKEIIQLEKDSRASYYLRNSFFLIKEKKPLKAVFYLLKSMIMNPHQFYQKIKFNSGIFK